MSVLLVRYQCFPQTGAINIDKYLGLYSVLLYSTAKLSEQTSIYILPSIYYIYNLLYMSSQCIPGYDC